MDAWLSEFKRGFYYNLDFITAAYLMNNKAFPTGYSMVGLIVFIRRIFDLKLDIDDTH
jgi:hypothetical protein